MNNALHPTNHFSSNIEVMIVSRTSPGLASFDPFLIIHSSKDGNLNSVLKMQFPCETPDEMNEAMAFCVVIVTLSLSISVVKPILLGLKFGVYMIIEVSVTLANSNTPLVEIKKSADISSIDDTPITLPSTVYCAGGCPLRFINMVDVISGFFSTEFGGSNEQNNVPPKVAMLLIFPFCPVCA
eukprot:gnl/Chilomastix_caulleri/1957.p1 GENE.gnl/Chilomastix_caulleri/1957~~gnl/Chilomastix_caulleri/1957.p1  ORF type:complete len:183 (-),score=27.34 gnl/Chilomastix_caulleri/1957:139-687(-)